MFDLKYVSWLEIHHPEAVPADHHLLSSVLDTDDFDTDDFHSLTKFFFADD